MSLEIALAENTAAIRELIAKLSTGATIPQDAVADKPATTAKSTKATKTDPKSDAAPASEQTPPASDNSKNSTSESNEASDSATEQPTYQEVAALITKVSRTVSREAAVELLDGFGAKRGPDLKPEQFADVVAACEKALA
ncbi:hypothetical protein H0A64_09835 [Alcaligenaceae bacterium]|nr:hypothetical protein [Alcaligenaceae bacterium]